MGSLFRVECVLVVEDEYLIAVDISELLKELGCRRIVIASSEAEALGLLDTEKPDLVTLDILLHGETCNMLDAVLAEQGIPYIYLSGFSPAARPEFQGAPWVTKPPERGEMEAALRAVLPEAAEEQGPAETSAAVRSFAAMLTGRRASR